MKQCTKCKQWKSRNEFHKKSTAKDGLKSQCKECRNQANREYKHSEAGQATRKRYEQSEYGKKVIRRYRQRPDVKAKKREYQRAYKKTEAGKATTQRYVQSDKGQTTIRRYARSAKMVAYRREYNRSEEGKARQKKHRQTKKGKKSHRQAAINYRRNHPEKFKAQDMVNKEIRAGRMPRPDTLPCEWPNCKDQAREYHHHSYEPEYWFDVQALCVKHHNIIHQSTR